MTLQVDVSGNVGSFRLEARFESGSGTTIVAGPNGAGKTHLLLFILGVKQPRRGLIRCGDYTLFDSERGIDLPPEQRGLGYVPHDYGLFPHLTVAENVAFARPHRGEDARERDARVRRWLAELELQPLAERRTQGLSAGERQRVALARAMASEPRALLLDEPFAALDVEARRQVSGFLASYLRSLRIPSLLVSHDSTDALELADRVLILERGRIVQQGSPEQLRGAPASSFVSDFMSGTR